MENLGYDRGLIGSDYAVGFDGGFSCRFDKNIEDHWRWEVRKDPLDIWRWTHYGATRSGGGRGGGLVP